MCNVRPIKARSGVFILQDTRTLKSFSEKEETDSLTGVRKIVNYVRRADIKSLTERYSVSDEVDSYYYYILLLKRVDQQFVPGIYLQTNKSDWFD